MDVYEALYTTRAMRRVKTDPIPLDVQAKILDAAIRAPTGGNTQNWRFLLIDDPEKIGALTPIYQSCIAQLWSNYYKDRIDAAAADPEAESSIADSKMIRSAQHLADHFAEIPLLLFAFAQGDPSGSSIYPAVWSAQLAARAEGVGTSLTQAWAFAQAETLKVLGVPEGENWHMSCCVTFGYPTGVWGVAKRRPVDTVAFRNTWDGDLGFSVPDPLWPTV
ncbi:MAG: nitroreductase [Mycobacterium sp.]|nr:nitroreductase [Mycobacterium sp.]